MSNLVYVDLILPLDVGNSFTYHTTDKIAQNIAIGVRVVVSFGSGKLYTAIVKKIHNQKPTQYKTKPIYAILDQEPLVTQQQLQFWDWLAQYYFCNLGSVYAQAFPAALKLQSESYLILQEGKGKHLAKQDLVQAEQLLLEALSLRKILSVKEASQLLDEQSVIPIVKNLLDAGWLRLQEKIKEKYKPKNQSYIQVSKELLANPTKLSLALKELQRAPKQRAFFLQLLQRQNTQKERIWLTKFLKKNNFSMELAKALEKKQIVKILEQDVDRVALATNQSIPLKDLNLVQKNAFDAVVSGFQSKDVTLLQGVASSGKTEIYAHLIQKTIKQRKRVLFLLPEIGITTQLLQRLQMYFPKQIGVYHSKFNQNERVEIWQKCRTNQYNIVIGPRSALFLPLQNIGLIVIDEAHDASMKQNLKKPYFHTRDAALVWAKIQKAKVLIGSATPSAETFFHAQNKKYSLVQLFERFGGTKPPEIQLIDLKKATESKAIEGHISHVLIQEIKRTLAQKKQVIIFQNRKGYAPILECLTCGYTANCVSCDVTLTYHHYNQQLKCHYCGYKEYKPRKCPKCSSANLDLKGVGTEQIAMELVQLFPEAKIQRLDAESTKRKHAYEKILHSFQNLETDILVGTQMITKGLDFSQVQLVGVIKADALLSYPDFRAAERTFQTLVQVAGRAGRATSNGKVLIQTYQAEHPVLQQIKNLDYKEIYNDLLHQRKQFNYPPFVRLIQIQLSHTNKEKCTKAAKELAKSLQPYFAKAHLLGPESAIVERIKNRYHQNILLKIPPAQSPKKIKQKIAEELDLLNTIAAFRAVKIKINVDPN